MPRPQHSAVAEPRLVHHQLTVAGLDPRLEGLRLAHLTDVHCGSITPARHVRRAVELTREARPHVTVMTGDYVCWRRSEAALLRDQLAGLPGRVFATLGNHDHFVGPALIAEELEQCGYTVLANQSVVVEHGGALFHVVGIDDPVTGRDDAGLAFSGLPGDGLRVVLCHCPDKFDEISARRADLMLAGHTHGGQINLGGLTERIFRQTRRRFLVPGFYGQGDSLMYLSPGVGFSGLPLRIGAGTRAEVTVFELRAASR